MLFRGRFLIKTKALFKNMDEKPLRLNTEKHQLQQLLPYQLHASI